MENLLFGGWNPFLLRLDLADEHCTDDEHAAYGGDGAHVLAEEDDGQKDRGYGVYVAEHGGGLCGDAGDTAEVEGLCKAGVDNARDEEQHDRRESELERGDVFSQQHIRQHHNARNAELHYSPVTGGDVLERLV